MGEAGCQAGAWAAPCTHARRKQRGVAAPQRRSTQPTCPRIGQHTHVVDNVEEALAHDNVAGEAHFGVPPGAVNLKVLLHLAQLQQGEARSSTMCFEPVENLCRMQGTGGGDTMEGAANRRGLAAAFQLACTGRDPRQQQQRLHCCSMAAWQQQQQKANVGGSGASLTRTMSPCSVGHRVNLPLVSQMSLLGWTWGWGWGGVGGGCAGAGGGRRGGRWAWGEGEGQGGGGGGRAAALHEGRPAAATSGTPHPPPRLPPRPAPTLMLPSTSR